MVLSLLGIGFYPTLRWLLAGWLGNPYYSHGFLVPLISLALALRLRLSPPLGTCSGQASRLGRGRVSEQTGASRDRFGFSVGVVALGGALGLHLWALAGHLYLLSAISLILALVGVVLALAGPQTLRLQAFPLAFLSFMVPLPWWESLTPRLARWVASLAAGIVGFAGIEALATGSRVELPGAALAIGDPCSGVSSLVALLTLATLYAFLLRGPMAARVAMVALAVPVALCGNLTRVVLLTLWAHHAGETVSLGHLHDVSGPVFFLVDLGLLAVLAKGLRCEGIRSDLGW